MRLILKLQAITGYWLQLTKDLNKSSVWYGIYWVLAKALVRGNYYHQGYNDVPPSSINKMMPCRRQELSTYDKADYYKEFLGLDRAVGCAFHLKTSPFSWGLKGAHQWRWEDQTCTSQGCAKWGSYLQVGLLAHVLLVSANDRARDHPLDLKKNQVLLSQKCFGHFLFPFDWPPSDIYIHAATILFSKLTWAPHMRFYKQIQGRKHTQTPHIHTHTYIYII